MHDYGSEAQEPQTESDQDERDNSQMKRVLGRYDKRISDVSERLGTDWEVVTLVGPSVPHTGAQFHSCRISRPISTMPKEEPNSTAFSRPFGLHVSTIVTQTLTQSIPVLLGRYWSTASSKPAKSMRTIDTTSICRVILTAQDGARN